MSGERVMYRIEHFTRGDDALHMAYSFDLMSCPFTVAGLRGVFDTFAAEGGQGWPCWSFSNHDVRRATTRIGGADPDPRLGRLLPCLLAALPGSVCLYQGEELGLPEADLAYADLQDPVGLTYWPESKGRDGCRTPMPWQRDAAHGGFSETRPWLPVPREHLAIAVDVQEADPGSTLNRTRGFLAWRRAHPALVKGGARFIDTDEPVLAFERTRDGERLLCVFNLSGEPAEWPAPAAVAPVTGHGFAGRLDPDGVIRLSGYEAFFGRIERET
jgi:alpha-glucosidase